MFLQHPTLTELKNGFRVASVENNRPLTTLRFRSTDSKFRYRNDEQKFSYCKYDSKKVDKVNNFTIN
uniref:Uncharacterized protein n=1 Tax=Panagrolaimus sp. PS1159 TaxID=55785 RepID=A0AC35GQ01_9BILA